jgi:hypothetical protein
MQSESVCIHDLHGFLLLKSQISVLRSVQLNILNLHAHTEPHQEATKEAAIHNKRVCKFSLYLSPSSTRVYFAIQVT